MALSRRQIEQMSRAAARSVYLGDGRLVARVLDRYMMVLDGTDLSLTPHLALSGFWESWVTVWLLAQQLTGERVINIGANCGYFTMLFADAVGPNGKVVAMEPQPRLAELCRESVLLNGFQERVTVLGFAAGAETGVAELYVPTRANASARLGAADESCLGEVRAITVEVVRADAWVEHATFAFVDAEGYEPEVWEGMSAMASLRTLVLEWTPSRYTDPGAFLTSMQDAGFLHLVAIGEDGDEEPVSVATLMNRRRWCMLVLRR